MHDEFRLSGARGLAEVSLGRNRSLVLLPRIALIYFLISLLLLAGVGIGVDRLLLPAMAASGAVVSEEWKETNRRLQQDMFRRNLATVRFPVWHSRGFPLPDDARNQPRILVMGDSFVWGDGYANMNDIWWRQLERELHWRGYTSVEVMAAGMCGWSTRPQLEAFGPLKDRFQPDLVIWGYVTNDPDEGIIKLIAPPFETGIDVDGRMEAFQEQFAAARRRKLEQEQQSPSPLEAWSYPEWEEKLLRDANLDHYRHTVARLGDTARASDIPMLVMTLPNLPMPGLFAERHDPVRPLFEAAGLPFVDISEAFGRAYGEVRSLRGILAWGVNPANGHPSPASARFHAVQAADYIEAHHPHVLGPRQSPAPRPGVVDAVILNDWVPHDLGVERLDRNHYAIHFTQTEGLMPIMPLGQPHVVLSLAMPALVDGLEIEGPELAAIEAHASGLDPEDRHDDGVLRPLVLHPRSGGGFECRLDESGINRAISTLRLAVTFVPGATTRRIELRFALPLRQ